MERETGAAPGKAAPTVRNTPSEEYTLLSPDENINTSDRVSPACGGDASVCGAIISPDGYCPVDGRIGCPFRRRSA